MKKFTSWGDKVGDMELVARLEKRLKMARSFAMKLSYQSRLRELKKR